MLTDLNWLDAGLHALVVAIIGIGVWIGGIRVMLCWPMRLLLSYVLAALTLAGAASLSGDALGAISDQIKAIDPILNMIVSFALLLVLMVIWFKFLAAARTKLMDVRDRYASGPKLDRVAGFPAGLFVGFAAMLSIAIPLVFYRQYTASGASNPLGIQSSRIIRDVDGYLARLVPRVATPVPKSR